MKRGDLTNSFNNALHTAAHVARGIGNEARQLEHIVVGLRNPFVAPVLIIHAVSRLVDVVDEELSKENPGPIVVGINNGIDKVSRFIDNAKSVINDKLNDPTNEIHNDQVVDNGLLGGMLSGIDFHNIN